MTAPRPFQEQRRLQVLRQYQILDTPPEARIDDIVREAAAYCDSPVAAFSIADKERLWFKSIIGMSVSELSRAETFCAHAVATCAPLVVEDALADERFRDTPLVAGPPYFRFYAGIPIKANTGEPLGALFVMDDVAHELPWDQFQYLKKLAAQLEVYIDDRRTKSAQ